jgi:DNA gyrase inhibitor GyrI
MPPKKGMKATDNLRVRWHETADMTNLVVRVERLQPMRVAWVRAFGRSPEREAWQLLSNWAKGAGLLEDPVAHPVFGFNNPSPAAGAKEYGYEFWIAVGPDAEPPEGIGLKDFPGGLYAVTSCRLASGSEVPQCWKALVRWVHASPYAWKRATHELEKVRNPPVASHDTELDLYLPLED